MARKEQGIGIVLGWQEGLGGKIFCAIWFSAPCNKFWKPR
jgi:hypothetical protein